MLQQPSKATKQKLVTAMRRYTTDAQPLYATPGWSYAEFRRQVAETRARVTAFEQNFANTKALEWMERCSIKRQPWHDFAPGREVRFAWDRWDHYRALDSIESAYELSLHAVRDRIDGERFDEDRLHVALADLRDLDDQIRLTNKNINWPRLKESVVALKRSIDSFSNGECGLECVFSEGNEVIEAAQFIKRPFDQQDIEVFTSYDPVELARYVIDEYFVRYQVRETEKWLVHNSWRALSITEQTELSSGTTVTDDELVDFLHDEIVALNKQVVVPELAQ